MMLINVDQLNIDWINMAQLTAREAAARLGVKRQTLYAYVSRGLLHRTLSLDGRTSLFDQAEVDALRTRNRAKAGDLSTVIVTSITKLGEGGHSYRGRPATDFVAEDADFEVVVDWVLGVDLASATEGADIAATGWQVDSDLVAAVTGAQGVLGANATMLNRLALTVTVASSHDPMRQSGTPPRIAQCAQTIITLMVLGLPERSTVTKPTRLADELWGRLSERPGTKAQRRALNAALVLLVDHGLAASTFSARIAASVRANPYAVVQAGLGPVAGIHHGAASAQVHRLLERAAEIGAAEALGEKLAAGEPVPGVGHAVYTAGDGRAPVLFDLVELGWKRDRRLQLVRSLRSIIVDEMGLVLNVDFSLGSLTWLAQMEADSGHLFAIARTGGWLAHAIEELDEKPIRFRPVAKFVVARSTLPEDSVTFSG